MLANCYLKPHYNQKKGVTYVVRQEVGDDEEAEDKYYSNTRLWPFTTSAVILLQPISLDLIGF